MPSPLLHMFTHWKLFKPWPFGLYGDFITLAWLVESLAIADWINLPSLEVRGWNWKFQPSKRLGGSPGKQPHPLVQFKSHLINIPLLLSSLKNFQGFKELCVRNIFLIINHSMVFHLLFLSWFLILIGPSHCRLLISARPLRPTLDASILMKHSLSQLTFVSSSPERLLPIALVAFYAFLYRYGWVCVLAPLPGCELEARAYNSVGHWATHADLTNHFFWLKGMKEANGWKQSKINPRDLACHVWVIWLFFVYILLR